jgi:hypothetical protein
MRFHFLQSCSVGHDLMSFSAQPQIGNCSGSSMTRHMAQVMVPKLLRVALIQISGHETQLWRRCELPPVALGGAHLLMSSSILWLMYYHATAARNIILVRITIVLAQGSQDSGGCGKFAYVSHIPHNRLAKPLEFPTKPRSMAHKDPVAQLYHPSSSSSSHSVDEWAAIAVPGASRRLAMS